MRYAKRVDANQTQVVSALRAAGASVEIIGLPVDLLVCIAGKFAFMEVKDGAKVPSAQKKTDVQEKFFAKYESEYPVFLVDGPDAAIRHLNVLKGIK
jgi:hypothetical protein